MAFFQYHNKKSEENKQVVIEESTNEEAPTHSVDVTPLEAELLLNQQHMTHLGNKINFMSKQIERLYASLRHNEQLLDQMVLGQKLRNDQLNQHLEVTTRFLEHLMQVLDRRQRQRNQLSGTQIEYKRRHDDGQP